MKQPISPRHASGHETTYWLLQPSRRIAWHSASSPRPAGVTDAVINAVPDVATDNMFSIGSVFGTNAKKTEKFVEMTASKLKALSL